jgi:hypothetical protein
MVTRQRHEEEDHQIALFDWIRLMANGDPRYLSIFAVPNGGRRGVREAIRLKRAGVVAGVADIVVAVPAGSYHGLFLELKRPRTRHSAKGVVTPEQREWLYRQHGLGYACEVVYGWEEARGRITSYFALNPIKAPITSPPANQRKATPVATI